MSTCVVSVGSVAVFSNEVVSVAAVDGGTSIVPSTHPAVDVKTADSAFACGALGCRRTDNLVQVVIDGYGRRVVCRDVHLHDLLGKVLGGNGRDD